jgi:hypothetical protein
MFPLIVTDQRSKTCSRSKRYSDLCASDKTRGAVVHVSFDRNRSKVKNMQQIKLLQPLRASDKTRGAVAQNFSQRTPCRKNNAAARAASEHRMLLGVPVSFENAD